MLQGLRDPSLREPCVVKLIRPHAPGAYNCRTEKLALPLACLPVQNACLRRRPGAAPQPLVDSDRLDTGIRLLMHDGKGDCAHVDGFANHPRHALLAEELVRVVAQRLVLCNGNQ